MVIEDGLFSISHSSAEKNIMDSLPTLSRLGFGPLTIVLTSLNKKFQRRVYSGTFEIPIYGKDSHILFYEIESKSFILVSIEKHFVGDIIGNSGTVYFTSNNESFCLNDLELKKKNNCVISTECPWGAHIFLENEVSNFKFAPESIRSFKPQEPPTDWSPVTSTIFPSNRIYIEPIRLIKTSGISTNETAFSNIWEDGTPSALLFIVDDKYMSIFLPENYSYSLIKETSVIFRSDGSFYDIQKGLFRTESGLEIITNSPWGVKLVYDESLTNISNTIHDKLRSFVLPSITVGTYEDISNKKTGKSISKRIRNVYYKLRGTSFLRD
ncbi:hypothetical protein HWI79_2369 [Cryptosporidium felis]|nr:hypothetical protein HWI79_2369 [Cryptosporidium felis]